MCNAAALVNDMIQRMEITKIANLFVFQNIEFRVIDEIKKTILISNAN